MIPRRGSYQFYKIISSYVMPFLTSLILFIVCLLFSKIDKLDEKIFTHMTNSEIHAPRTMFVSRAEFDVQCKLMEKEQTDILNAIKDLRKN